MLRMTRFISTYANNIDSKGRVSVPPGFKKTLDEQNSSMIYLYESYEENRIEGCGVLYWNHLNEYIQQLDKNSDEWSYWAYVQSTTEEINFGKNDTRIVIPKSLREFAGIENKVLFAGKGLVFELWSPEGFQKSQESLRAWGRKHKPTVPGMKPKPAETGSSG